MKLYDNFVLKIEAEKGILFEISQEKGEIIIRGRNIVTANDYSKNYVNPPIPDGYKHVCGKWNNGFVIERRSDGSQFGWIPVGSLVSNGTLDGNHFSEKFGRRNYMDDQFSDSHYNEPLNDEDEFFKRIESVKKYGGFYLSCFNISKSPEGKPQSVKGIKPWTDINFYNAKKVASTIENNEEVETHLPFGSEFDSALEWFIETEVKTRNEIIRDSRNWGNYSDSEIFPKKVFETGSREEWCVNNFYDFAGNVGEWTQEVNCVMGRTIRSGDVLKPGQCCPVAYRKDQTPYFESPCTGFRAALCMK